MREIKFRAWDCLSKKMIRDIVNLERQEHNNFGAILRDSTKIIMQFIGLHDRNGKEIYEGDIVHEPEQDIYGVVEWMSPEFIIRQYPRPPITGFDSQKAFYWQDGANFSWDELEVVGNIHENPDLLGERSDDDGMV